MTNPVTEMAIRGHLKMITKEAIRKKPEVLTFGGFLALDSEGKQVIFEWFDFNAGTTVQEDGRVVIDAEFRDFEWAFTKAASQANVDNLTPETLAQCKLKEVTYLCKLIDDEDAPDIELEVLEFDVFDPYKTGAEVYSFNVNDEEKANI